MKNSYPYEKPTKESTTCWNYSITSQANLFKKKSLFIGKSAEETFNQIYNANYWGSNGSISGPGSDEDQTKQLLTELNSLIGNFNIKTVLDIPCGDFNWIKNIDLTKITYVGADIVKDLVIQNTQLYGSANIEFKHINLINDPLPKSDIIINRDCLVHLSFKDILEAIQNIKSSGSKYLLSTTFPDYKFNYDIVTGDWRTINLEQAPFNFPKPILLIKENCSEGNGIYRDKSLGLWKIEDI